MNRVRSFSFKSLIKFNKFLCSLQSAFIFSYFDPLLMNSLTEMLFRPRFKLNAT